ncbi:hypothetical protein [Bacillus sp. ISTL8]|uniref:hypothetical protein n=1 Tax=Bacillus sp. ISTL8 TaxID=2596896 RepID=UPI001456656D|nr:hypothetical protein [Bacillus sp. ISTL8]
MIKELPTLCYTTHSKTGETVIISKGQRGYWKCEDQRPADELNKTIGVTKAVRMAMEFGRKNGWDTDGANPANWNEDGTPKKEEKKEAVEAKKETVEKKKECMLCYNTNEDEIEKVPLFSDGDGNEGYHEEWMCKEGKGCC